MRFNTLVCDITKIDRQSNGDFRLNGLVNFAVGEDYLPDQGVSILVKGNKEDYIGKLEPGIFLLEKVDPESGYCAFPTRIGEGKTPIPALIGPLQVSWTDSANKYQTVTLDKAGLEGDALDKAGRVSKQFAGTMRVYRDLIELDADGDVVGASVATKNRVADVVADMIADNPQMTAVILRDGQQARMARLGWDKAAETHVFVPPKNKDGQEFQFKGDRIELIPVQQMNYLTNRFNPKKSSAVAEINNQLGKSERQLAFEAKLYPAFGSFASGIATLRDLPGGGHTLERVAASFPTLTFKSVPGELRIQEKPKDQVNAVDTVRDLLGSLGVPQELVQQVLEAAKNRPGPTHGTESEMANDTRPGLPKAGYTESVQAAAKTAQAALQREKAAAPAPAAAPQKSEPAAANPAPAARPAPVAKPAPATAKPAPEVPPADNDAPPAPRVTFGRKR